MFLKAIAFAISFAMLVFIGLVLLGANSMRQSQPKVQSVEAPQLTPQAQPRSATTECADLRPLLDQLLTRSYPAVAEFEE